MNIVIVLMVVVMMGCAIWLVNFAAKAASDPDNDFSQLEFALSSMGLLITAFAISYFAIVYIVMAPEPTITQSSQSTHNAYVAAGHYKAGSRKRHPSYSSKRPFSRSWSTRKPKR